MSTEYLYHERVSSKRTQALFMALTILFLVLAIWRSLNASLVNGLTIVFLIFFLMFLFYSLNYRILDNRLTRHDLLLKFGLFTWIVPLELIEDCYQDDISLWRIGGAGIHFSPIRGRYRAMFNFLEYERVVIVLKHKQGFVWDIAFTTRHPKDVMRLIQGVNSSQDNTA